MTTVEDLMTAKVISVGPQTPLAEAVEILTEHNFNGLPVVDDSNTLVGLITEHNLILDDSYVHLKTLFKLLNEVKFYKKDISPIKADLQKVLSLKVSDVMIREPQVLHPDSSIEEASQMFGDPKVNPIPVVDNQKKLVGILSLSDLTKLYGVSLKSTLNDQQVDKNIDQFLNDFEKKFVLVTKARTETWLIVSILFALVWFIIAFFFILRINV